MQRAICSTLKCPLIGLSSVTTKHYWQNTVFQSNLPKDQGRVKAHPESPIPLLKCDAEMSSMTCV